MRLGDGAHLQPVAEEHDRDQRRELPPDLDVEQAERARPGGDEGDDDRQGDEGHHPGLPAGQLPLGATEEHQSAVEEHDGAEDRRGVLLARERGYRVAEPLLDVVAEQDDRRVSANVSQNLSRNMATDWPAWRSCPGP